MSVDDARLYAQTRSGGATDGVSVPLRTNEYQDLFITQGLPRDTDVTRRGLQWSVMPTSAVAALVARPTTTAAFEIWNGNAAGGPSLIITRLFSLEVVATAAANGAGIWAQVTAAKATPSAGASVVRGHSGKPYTGAVVTAASTTVVDSGWFPWGPPMAGPATATPGPAWEAKVDGGLIVPPQCSLCLHVVASLVGDTFATGASWVEATLTIA